MPLNQYLFSRLNDRESVGSLVVSLPLNTTSLWLNSQNFAVVYEVFDYANNKYIWKGIIPGADIKIENSEAVFEVESTLLVIE